MTWLCKGKHASKNLPKFNPPKVSDVKLAKVFLCQKFMLYGSYNASSQLDSDIKGLFIESARKVLGVSMVNLANPPLCKLCRLLSMVPETR